MSPLPTGRIALLFTDIEGSTRLWELFPQQMPAALSLHNTLISATIMNHGGVIFRTAGDSFCAAFTTVDQAIHAVVAAQRSLAQAAWEATGALRVRMALHIDQLSLHDGEYGGPPMNRLARILATAHGGQSVLSQAMAQAAPELPSGISLRDLGSYQLRDLAEPEQIHQLIFPDLPNDFPPLRVQADASEPELPDAFQQAKLPGMPRIDYDALYQREQERQQRKRTKKSPPTEMF